MHEDRLHADVVHEDDVGEDGRERLLIVHDRSADLHDDDLVVESLDVRKRLDQRLSLVDCRIDHFVTPSKSGKEGKFRKARLRCQKEQTAHAQMDHFSFAGPSRISMRTLSPSGSSQPSIVPLALQFINDCKVRFVRAVGLAGEKADGKIVFSRDPADL